MIYPILHTPDLQYRPKVYCFVPCTNLRCGQRSLSTSSTNMELGLCLPSYNVHTDVPSWIHFMMFFFVNYNRNTSNQEKSDRKPLTKSVRYYVCLLYSVCGVRPQGKYKKGVSLGLMKRVLAYKYHTAAFQLHS